ncbi:hypothetical protein CPC08DRAFT_345049 [Agrocybe pediades]|nr:hypothetical protein CPC08DRAFT_345049 [Agrocybe pediades]
MSPSRLDTVMLQILHTLEECNAKLETTRLETDKMMEVVDSEDTQTHRRHGRFYFNDGNVMFLVKRTLFKVHRYFFERDSPIFASMFSLPPPVPVEDRDSPPFVEGDSDEHPILLEGVCPQQFEQILSILYPSDFSSPDPQCIEEWTSVLNLATRWDFSSIRALAIEKLATELTGRSPALKLAIAKQHDIEHWLVPAYTALCIRNDPLDINEGRMLGLDDVISIENIRQSVRYPSNLNRDSESVARLVKQMFAICQSTSTYDV